MSARGGWMKGRDKICTQAQAEFPLKSICIHILHQIIFVTLTRSDVVKKTKQNKTKQTKQKKNNNNKKQKPKHKRTVCKTLARKFQKRLGQRAKLNQNLKYCIDGSCSKPNHFVSLAGTSLSSLRNHYNF